MGLGGRKPLLPAPTESLVDESNVEESGVEEVATDLSVRTDRTHHTIPEDGSPITISTKPYTSRTDKFTKTTQTSQTSLLIEYFEGGKGSDPNRRPSVRVKVIPSKSKNKEKGEGHIVLTEARGTGTRNLSTSRRISLSSQSPQVAGIDSDISVLESLHIPAHKEATPLDIEIQQNSDISDMSVSPEARYIPAPSDISSMPPDSMLGVPQSTVFQPTARAIEGSNVSSLPPEESVVSGSEVMESTSLKPPVIPRERNTSNENFTQKVIEKISNKPREPIKIGQGRSDKSSSRSTSRDVVANPYAYERSKTTGKNFRETDSTLTSATEQSVLSNSIISPGARSDPSIKSNNSINNPKLLQTVEDAIRRLILPELKELKKDQRHQTQKSKYENSYSDLSENSIAQAKTTRRSTSGSKSRRRSSKDHADTSGSRRRRSSQRELDFDSLSDSSSRRDASISSISAEDPALKKRHGSGHRNRDLAATGMAAAGLTAAALQERESEDSLQRRRRRKRSKSRSSRSGSIAESEEIFEKSQVPPMPMQSEMSSDLTRSSLLSSNTGASHTPTQREVHQVVRDSPRDIQSSGLNTPPRLSGDLRHTLGTHHGNFSEHNLSSNRLTYEEADDLTQSPETDHYHSFSAEDILTDQERLRQYERNLHTQHPIRRGLSPIQSVASYQTTEPNRHSMHHRRSQDSIASMKERQRQLKEEVSISSFTSAPASPDFKKTRPHDISLGKRGDLSSQHIKEAPEPSPEFQSIGIHDRFSDDEHDQYRDSYLTDNQSINGQRFSQMTDTSSDFQYVDKVTAGQHVVPVIGAKPEYVPGPFGVESGVASLVEPSVLSGHESSASHKSSFVQEKTSNRSLPRGMVGARMTSPLKEHMSIRSESSLAERMRSPRVDLSPPQSPARSYEENLEYAEQDQPRSSNLRSPLPSANVEEQGSPESEITTNPSVIQGPIGGINSAHADPWVPNAITPPMPSQGGMSRDFSSGAIDLIPEGLNVSQRHTYDAKPNTYVIGANAPTPPGNKMDEGYQTGDNYPSPGPLMKSGTALDNYGLDEDFGEKIDDPFTTKRNQYMSGLSQGMSPLYEGATGRGIDRIQSKDIVALMEHLAVRDAQRNAVDTEILFTLVRSAADMRNSFEEMKAFIAEQDEIIMSTADKQHAQTQKVIGGPRPPPASNRSTRTPTQEDIPNKRRNVFKRALQGLGSKNTAELQNIESMLMQLLDEVEALRANQSNQVVNTQPRTNSVASEEATRQMTDPGYEPEGRAGTASTGADRSGVFSIGSSRQGQYSAARRVPENRVSTVLEGDEESDAYGAPRQFSDNQRTPRATSPNNGYSRRAQSEPLETPEGRNQSRDAFSDENYGDISHNSADRKHKTFSSILPKVVSRWSKTTASSGGDEYRQSTQSKTRPYSQVSRSGDAINDFVYENNPDDRLRSATSLQNETYYREQENRPPSPLVPSAISDNPKYQAHRDSGNMEHPQPRQGSKYQLRLENVAHSYRNDNTFSPVSQASSNRWDNQQMNVPRNQSPVSERGYSEVGSGHQRSGSSSSLTRRNQGPPRPPKIPDNDEPLVPQRGSKLSHGTMSPSTYVDNVRAARGSPAFDKSPVGALRSPQGGNIGRKPSGPRPLSSQSNRDAQKKTRFTDSPVQSVDSGRY